MKATQYVLKEGKWKPELLRDDRVNWVLAFGDVACESARQALQSAFPAAIFTGCSTAGEIADIEVNENSLSVVAVTFEKGTCLDVAFLPVMEVTESLAVGRQIGRSLLKPGLKHIFVLSAGVEINGSELVTGLSSELPAGVVVTGGLSGDGDRFQLTHQWCGEQLETQNVIAIGFYGENLQVGYGSMGGWTPFGPDRVVTKAKDNILYELDGQSALALYKSYLGDYAKDLPASGLLFPISLSEQGVDKENLVRTILGVDEVDQSLIFAGDIPVDSYARLMKASTNQLIDGAQQSAENCVISMGQKQADLAILISCVGRKMVLNQRVEEEVEAVRDVFGDKTLIAGFYSYGEISPLNAHNDCVLHNQTMTVTTFAEN